MAIDYSELTGHRGQRITEAGQQVPYECDHCGKMNHSIPDYVCEDHENSRLLLFCSEQCKNDHPHEGGWVDESARREFERSNTATEREEGQ